MIAYACLPRLTLNRVRVDREIYVVSIASDLRGRSADRPRAVGAANQTLRGLAAEVESAMEFVVAAVSNVFHHVDRRQPVSLSGDGIVLYPPTDPRGLLALHFAVVESDRQARDAGALLRQMFADRAVRSGLGDIARITAAAGSVPPEAITAVMAAAITALAAALAANRDDILFSHNHSGLEISSYGGSPQGRDYRIGNRAVRTVLRVYSMAGDTEGANARMGR